MQDVAHTPGATGNGGPTPALKGRSPTPALPRREGAKTCFGSLLLRLLGCFGAVEIEVIPVVALARPEQPTIRKPTTPDTIVVDKFLGALFDECGELTCLCIHGQQLIKLMSTLIVFHRDIAAVGCPLEPIKRVLKTHPQPLP